MAGRGNIFAIDLPPALRIVASNLFTSPFDSLGEKSTNEVFQVQFNLFIRHDIVFESL